MPQAKQVATRLILQDNGPIHVGVKRALRARIGKEWKVGDRLPSISDLAKQFGVGQNSAQRAVHDLVAEGVLFSRRRLGVFVREVRPAARGRSKSQRQPLSGRTIALAYHGESPLPFVQRMIDGFREVISDTGADTIMSPMELRASTLPDVAGAWATVLFNPGSPVAAAAGKQNLTIVSTSDHLHPDLLSRFDSVGVDQYQGGALAGKTLREAGCERVCYLGHRVSNNAHRYDLTSTSRLCGFERGWGEILDDRNLLYAPGYSIHAGGLRFGEYMRMSPRPNAVFVASDELAIGFIAAAAASGLRPGHDFHLVGFDGQDRPDPKSEGIQLTTVRVPAAEMGRRAAELMVSRFEDPSRLTQRLLLSCSMSHGNTTFKCP